jgi:hypothetical protein
MVSVVTKFGLKLSLIIRIYNFTLKMQMEW